MKRTAQIIQDMRKMRRDIVDIYNQELCDKVDHSTLKELSIEIESLKSSLVILHARVGLDIFVG